jgi:hypothetical protein
MTLAPLREASLESSSSSGLEEELRTVALLLRRRCASHGFVSLLLAGSLAQNEGSLLLTPSGPRLFNDIDLILVTERGVSLDVALEWEREATRLVAPDSAYAGERLSPLGLHVDLAVLPRRRLRRLPCTLFNFDLQSARVLAGEDVLPEMPRFRPTEIPVREALQLLGNRCLSLCESAGPPEACTALWMHYHALKAVIDAGAALMILSGQHRTALRERLPVLGDVLRFHFPSLLARWPRLPGMVEDALTERRQLRADLEGEVAMNRWNEARDVITETLRCSLARVLNLPEQSPWPVLSDGARRWWTSLDALAEGRRLAAALARWASLRAVGWPRRLLAQAAVHAAAPHLLQAIEPGGETAPERRGDLALAGWYVSKLTRGRMPELADGDWRAVRDQVIDCWKKAV